jgi:hypothetical protein
VSLLSGMGHEAQANEGYESRIEDGQKNGVPAVSEAEGVSLGGREGVSEKKRERENMCVCERARERMCVRSG